MSNIICKTFIVILTNLLDNGTSQVKSNNSLKNIYNIIMQSNKDSLCGQSTIIAIKILLTQKTLPQKGTIIHIF